MRVYDKKKEEEEDCKVGWLQQGFWYLEEAGQKDEVGGTLKSLFGRDVMNLAGIMIDFLVMFGARYFVVMRSKRSKAGSISTIDMGAKVGCKSCLVKSQKKN